MTTPYYEKNKEHVKLKVKEWREKNHDRLKANRRAYYLKNRALIIARARAWEIANPERKRERNRLRRLEKEYGITQEQLDALLSVQGNTCAICRAGFKSTADTHIDHCHLNGHVRAVLCSTCNKKLGVLEKDGGVWLSKASIYLLRYKTASVVDLGLWRAHS